MTYNEIRRNQVNERIERMTRLREQGNTYEVIAKMEGVSKQRVFQLIGGIDRTKVKPLTKKQCIYDGLRQYLNENHIGRSEFTRKIYGYNHPSCYACIIKWLQGVEMTMSVINKILSITGLTYEQAFLWQEGSEAE